MRCLRMGQLAPVLVSFLLLLAVLVPLAPAHAQAEDQTAAVHAGDGMQVEDLERLVATLESEPERAQLVSQLKALIAAQRRQAAVEDTGPASALLAALSARLEDLTEQFLTTAAVLSDAPRMVSWIKAQAGDEAARDRWLDILGKLFVVLALGFFAERIVDALLTGVRRAVEARNGHSWWLKAPLVVARLALDAVPIAVFAAVAYLSLPVLAVKGDVRSAALMLMTAYVSARSIIVLAHAAFVPGAAGIRMLPLDDETAQYLYIWARRLINVTVYGYVAAASARMLGLPAGSYNFALKVLGLVVATMLIILILQNRQPVADWIRANGPAGRLASRLRGLRTRIADVWHILALLYVVVIYGIWALNVRGGFEYVLRASLLTVLILVLAALVAGILKRLVDRAFSISHELRSQFPQLEPRANRYLPVLYNVLRGAVALLTLLALMQAWGINTLAWMASDFGSRVISGLVSIIAVVIVALIVWELVSSSIERYLNQSDGNGQRIQRSARARTLLPLLRNVVMVVLLVMVVLIVMSELGINIAPLLAGAGVVGLAIGFGSQKLVQDLITGAFILFEDTISVGDVVRLGEHAGSVEAMSIRTIRLRDFSGAVHTIPFSTVATVVNMTKDFSFSVIEVGVAYREDTDQVVSVLKDIGAELQGDPEYNLHIQDALEVVGIDRFDASSVVIKARLKTAPTKQWMVAREFNRRMKKRFDELGIEIPFPHTTLYFGEDRSGRAAPAHIRLDAPPASPPPSSKDNPSAAAKVDVPTRHEAGVPEEQRG